MPLGAGIADAGAPGDRFPPTDGYLGAAKREKSRASAS